MKLQFKIQSYQTEAFEDTANVFRCQPRTDAKRYGLDLGKRAKGTLFTEDSLRKNH